MKGVGRHPTQMVLFASLGHSGDTDTVSPRASIPTQTARERGRERGREGERERKRERACSDGGILAAERRRTPAVELL